MTDEQINITMAEVAGWKFQEGEHPVYGGSFIPTGWYSPNGDFHNDRFAAPDFLNDLNAVHEVEMKYFDPAKDADLESSTHGYMWCMKYDAALAKVTGSCMANYCATARQRCKAILRILSKREE